MKPIQEDALVEKIVVLAQLAVLAGIALAMVVLAEYVVHIKTPMAGSLGTIGYCF